MSRAVLAVVLVVLGLSAVSASAESRSTTRDGMTLSVSKASGLRVQGEQVRVTGRGYDRLKGIYVAFCVDNGPGKVPTPCGGGADTEGSSGNSVWISDLPPAYGTGLARPYGEDGSFDVTINVRAQLNEQVSCLTVRCAVVTRNDHTRSDDRSQDVAVPVSFAQPVKAAPAGRPAAGPERSGTAGTPVATAGTSSSGPAQAVAPTGHATTAAPTPTGPSPAAGSSSSPLAPNDSEAVASTTSSGEGSGRLPLVAVLLSVVAVAVLGSLPQGRSAVRQLVARARGIRAAP